MHFRTDKFDFRMRRLKYSVASCLGSRFVEFQILFHLLTSIIVVGRDMQFNNEYPIALFAKFINDNELN